MFQENFNFSMEPAKPDKKEKKEKKDPSPQDLRAEAWKKDTAIFTRERKGVWSAVGDISEFIYKEGMTEDQAIEYMRELNKNKRESEIF